MRTPLRFLLIAFVLALLTAACGGAGDSAALTGAAGHPYEMTTAATTTTAPAFSDFDPGQEGGEAPAGDGTDAQGVVSVLQPGDFGRDIVYTASLEIEVDDVVAAGQRALVELSGLGGVLFGQETSSGPEPRSVLTIKLLPANFAAALERLAGLGTLVSQTVHADDVTERVVDLESRITTATASVERLRNFLEGATDLEGVAQLEAELLQRETDLELLRGQLRTLQDSVALATIVLVLTQPMPGPAYELVQTAYSGHDDGGGCPGSAELAVDEGDEITVCYEVMNSGDTYLAEIEVRDEGFDFDPDDAIWLVGDPAALLPPGGRLLVAYEADADPHISPGPMLRATAVDANGTPLHLQAEGADVENLELRVAADDSLPGFGDTLAGAWHALQRFG
ncbi:MAG: putative lipoprotein, partial [Actinobacteria bacterium]|nr:putative lipoprotein [Actinomycetota bacterium]